MARARASAEALAVAALLLILVGLPAAVVVYQFVVRPAVADVRVIDITARVPEAGGFSPETIRIAAGEAVRLRFSVPDVTHGIAIGPGLGIDLGHVDPGQVREVRVTFDRPGRYTLYCNAWCSPSHWRMRGTILVYDPAHPDGAIPTEAPDPVIESLVARRVDIDAPHDAPATPGAPFRITRGTQVVERLGTTLPRELAERDWRRRHSPAEAWARLVDGGLAADAAWDAVASLWVGSLDRARLETAATLFAKNCAACHGESGDGRGPGAAALAAQGIGQHDGSKKAARPADFTRARSMLGGTSERYYAKLRRGGMGTGMPSWGPILTPDETWMLVDYLWTFVFGRDGLARTDSTRSRTFAVAPGTASLEARSDESHMVTASYCSRRSDHGVHAGAGELTEIADLHPIVSNERAKHVAVLG